MSQQLSAVPAFVLHSKSRTFEAFLSPTMPMAQRNLLQHQLAEIDSEFKRRFEAVMGQVDAWLVDFDKLSDSSKE